MSSSHDHGKRRKHEDGRRRDADRGSRKGYSPSRSSSFDGHARPRGGEGSRRRDREVNSRMYTDSKDSGGKWSSHGNRSKSRHDYSHHRQGIHPHRERGDDGGKRKRREKEEEERGSGRGRSEDEMRDKEVVERSRGDEMKKSKWSKSSSGICDPLHQASLPTSSSLRSKLRDETVSEIAEQAAACSRDEHQRYQKSHLSLPGSEKLLVQSKDGEDTEHLKTGTSTTSSSFPTSPLLHVSANQPATVVASSSNLVVPGLSNQRQKQEEKKKLLWGDAANKTVKSPWEGLKFSTDSKTEKFRKLMGIKSTAIVSADDGAKDSLDKKQEKIFQDLQDQYSIARMATHSQARGAGLGSFPNH